MLFCIRIRSIELNKQKLCSITSLNVNNKTSEMKSIQEWLFSQE